MVVVVAPEVVVVAPAVVVVVAWVTVTPQTDWAMIRSPTAVGPRRRMWAPLTVMEPSALVICSL